MKFSLTMATTSAALALSQFSAHAACVDPLQRRNDAATMPHIVLPQISALQLGGSDASDSVVGTWLVSYTVEGEDGGQAFTQWHSDGTEWESINHPVLGGNLCMGSWKQLDAKHVYRYHVGWLYTDGNVSGYFVETETDKITGKRTYAGHNEITFYDMKGSAQSHVKGTASATRITP
ncbi:MAG: hypothetical protein JO056_02960 [Alphaproteobacteria bacterium]|jgi:hypothetical protein|nr:hypothetical protein [Alphaproteobacteria bacterium]